MNELPSGWARAVLPELVASDGVFSDGDWVESKDQDLNGDVRLIQLADIGDGYYRDRSARFLTLAKAHQLGCTFLENGDVLIARMPDPLGRACCYPGDPKRAVTVVDVCIMRPGTESVNPRWLMHTINAPQLRSAMTIYEMGTTRKRISRGNLARILLPIPPPAEQERIVAVIEEEFSRLDAGVAALERVRQNLRRMRTAVLLDAYAPFETTLTAASGQELFPFVTSGSRGWAKYYSSDGPEFLRIGNVPRTGIDLDLAEVQRVVPPANAEGRRTRVQSGDLVISITADLGRVAVVPQTLGEAYINQHLALARPIDDAVPRYLAWYLASPFGLRQWDNLRRGATKIGLGLDDIRSLRIPIPTSDEQQSTVDVIESAWEGFQWLEQSLLDCERKAQHLRSSILAAAFSGKLVAQDPTDEPAAILLERIATERASSNGYKSARTRKPRPSRGGVTA